MRSPAGACARSGGRPLKRWRYVGVYGADADALLRRASASAGLPQAFWAVLGPRDGRCASARASAPAPSPSATARAARRDRGVAIDLALDGRRRPSRSSAATAAQYDLDAQAGRVRARGSVGSTARERRSTRAAIVDDSAGYHARAHRVGVVAPASASRATGGGRVEPRHRRPRRRARVSERTRLGRRRAARGRPGRASPPTSRGALRRAAARCASPARPQRARSDNLLLFARDYRQPFGTFAGMLPGGVELREGYGVMERHRARW